MGEQYDTFPRPLAHNEWLLIEWLLPDERSGYSIYRSLLKSLQVIGYGRWGDGNFVLGEPGDTPDISGPMQRIYASGTIESEEGIITVSVHEYAAGQLEIQITNLENEDISDKLKIRKKSTYSFWEPGAKCPFCGKPVREIAINNSQPMAVLAVCYNDNRLWLYDETDGVNHPIPATNLYNELMLYKHIKDPVKVLNSKNLFNNPDDFPDQELRQAFVNYNKTWYRISIRS
jgi:hypothetical protein